MKVAVFHDYFSTIGGGEKVVLAIADCLHADIYTTDISVPGMEVQTGNLFSLGNTPSFPLLRQMGSAMRFFHADISDQYDMFVFSGNWAHHASYHHAPSLFYCHTPVRALYDLYPVFRHRLPWPLQPGYAAWSFIMRKIDRRSVQRIGTIVANSQTVRKRIKQYYHRDSSVIYPPVDISQYSCSEYGEFWLSVNRLYPEKRIELQIDAFSRMPGERLVIAGGYNSGDHAAPYATKIRKMTEKCNNVQIMGQISDQELLLLYSRCRGLVCTALEEDFGITPLEAMASGKPVIAVAEGGFLETVTPECGQFIRPEVDDIISAVKALSGNPEKYREPCRKRASDFDISRFNSQIRETVAETYEKWSNTV